MTIGQEVTIEYNDAGVVRTIFTLPATKSPEKPSVLAFSLPKAGSVLLDVIMRELSAKMGLTYVSIMGEFFDLGLPVAKAPASTSSIFLECGYCYGGFRFLSPMFDIPILKDAKSLLLVRDPRDMLVSHYFSTRSSHPAPGSKSGLTTSMKTMPARKKAQTLSVDDYVLDFSRFYLRHMKGYMDAITKNRGSFRVYRYEDVIFEKRKWIADICETFGWDVAESTINQIADKNDIAPSAENEAKHVRQVTPGDYKRKLKPETIDQLNNVFEKPLKYFDYDV